MPLVDNVGEGNFGVVADFYKPPRARAAWVFANLTHSLNRCLDLAICEVLSCDGDRRSDWTNDFKIGRREVGARLRALCVQGHPSAQGELTKQKAAREHCVVHEPATPFPPNF